MKKFALSWILLAPLVASAATMNFSGSFRGSAEYYNKLGLGQGPGTQTKSFIAARALLNPNLIIDDHFSIYSQWSLLQSPFYAPSCSALAVGQGAYILGDDRTVSFNLCRAWMEWTTDFGSFKVGRMPFSWGYGLFWDGGNGVWDDFQTTLDRLEYRLHLGNVVGAVAYSKQRKESVLGSDDDQEFYTVYLQYDNEELEVEGGILYEKQVRSSSQAIALRDGNIGRYYGVPTGSGTPPPIAVKMPYPLSSNVLDVYLKKRSGGFSFGGEINWISGTAVDYQPNGRLDDLNAFALTANVAYEYHKVRAFLDFLYASGDSNLDNDQNSAFTLLHRNRRPGLLLGRELLGPYHGNHVALGSPVVYGRQGSFSGVYYFRPGLRFEWSQAWASGLEVIFAQKAATAPGEVANLGIEVDVGTDYQVYKNLEAGLAVGYLFPGGGLGVVNPQGPFAVRGSLNLTF